ncbi:MAG: 3-hydroxyacyl-ACP dehydratase FabZ [Deltaproteobacteria bacterium]|nr:3-hydroxyacyl-ACP dehydratase FabZ [Deltaproteobacteria bacterium]
MAALDCKSVARAIDVSASDKQVNLDIHRILQILPHRFPFVMVDRVIEVVPHKRIRGHKCISYNEPWFQGHFPQRPIMPGVLIVEALAQIGGILAYASQPFDPTTNLMFFLGIDKVKFRHTVIPGDRLDLMVQVIHHRSNVWKLSGEASVDGTVCAQGDLLATIVDRSP